jgi:hypothetical protein
VASADETAPAVSTADSGVRENGQRLGLRFRRGSRGPMRPGEIPLIGVVEVEAPILEPVGVAVAEAEPEAAEPSPVPKKRAPRARAPRKKSSVSAAQSEPAGDTESETAPKRPRSRPRPKKKASD